MSNGLDTGRVFSEARLRCEDADGNWVIASQRNLGWHEGARGYVSEFVVDGRSYYSLFSSGKNQDDVCPDPAQRLAVDLEFMELKLGLRLVDAEPVPV